MNKTELINAVAEKTGLSKKDSDKAVNAVIDTIVETMKAGDKVIYSKYAGNEVKLGEEEYIIVKQSDILAIVE